ncbi:hypothetical protein GDO78_015975 [Eleutherodactylus coqui]|uniref:Uncharacterized protein n=1 Tax=Eleutherodactylus coqui TaxID=57060 RepID=A0A8J6B0J0_ELECQ|nr:hypothetical protein GDO78_015975 [Eleutherodactylus coqui]
MCRSPQGAMTLRHHPCNLIVGWQGEVAFRTWTEESKYLKKKFPPWQVPRGPCPYVLNSALNALQAFPSHWTLVL